jgi:RNA-directed DNA polymerase
MTMQSAVFQTNSRARKLSPLRPETLHIQNQLVLWTKSGRKHWDLFRHLLNPHLLADATKLVLQNAGTCGIDRVTCAELKAEGWEFVRRLREKLKAKTYRPKAVRRVYIPKRDGKKRPLGIPGVEDRVVQRALALLLEPIYEQSFLSCSYGFRPKRRAVQCVYDIAKKTYSHRFIIDADIEDFFGSVHHNKLMGMLKQKIVDPRILELIRKILRSGFKDETGWQATLMGTPQGGPLSPLLANIYLHHVLDERFAELKKQSPRFELFRFADDLIVTCLTEEDLRFLIPILRGWLNSGGLKFHPKKSRAVDMRSTNDRKKAKFDFLGYKFHLRSFADNPQRTWIARQPSERARKQLRANLRQKLIANLTHEEARKRVHCITKPTLSDCPIFGGGSGWPKVLMI